MIANETLKQQIKDFFGNIESIPEILQPFILKVGETYSEFELVGRDIANLGILNTELSQNKQPEHESKVAKQMLDKAKRMYSFLSQINQAIVHSRDAETIFKNACEVAIASGEFKSAWIGIFDNLHKTINIVEGRGVLEEDVVPFTTAIYESTGPQYYVLQTGTYFICNDIKNDTTIGKWKSFAELRGYGSCMVLPIRKSGQIVGSFNLFASTPNAFTSEEIALLVEAAGDISFALDVFEKEDRLKHSELRLNQAQAIANIGSWELNLSTRYILWSKQHCIIYGLPGEHNIHSLPKWVSFIHPDDRANVLTTIKEVEESLQPCAFAHRIIRKDGIVRYIQCECYFEYNKEGQPISIYGVSNDVTEMKEAENKLLGMNRLYSFTSILNQTIIHVDNEKALFDKVCDILIDIGKFKIAWIGIPDRATKRLFMASQCGIKTEDVPRFENFRYDDYGPQEHVLKTGKAFICNDMQQMDPLSGWRKFALSRQWGSFTVFPIRKLGTIVATLNLCGKEGQFLNPDEVQLLEEAAGEISFALDSFEKERLRRDAEKRLEHNEMGLKKAQSIAHLGSWELDFSTGVATWSEEALRIYGLPTNQPAQSFDVWFSHIHPDDKEFVSEEIEKAKTTFSNTALYFRILREDGYIRHVHSQSQYLLNENGVPVGMYGVEYDVTDIKQAERSLLQSKANLRLIVDLIPQSIFAMDGSGRFVFANVSFANLYGLTPKELVYRNIADLIPDKSLAEQYCSQAKRVIESGEVTLVPEMPFTDHLGNKKIFYSTKVPYTPAGTANTAMLGISLDITEQKKAEYEKTKIIADMVQRNQDLEQFSYIVSHNLRAPVANIIGIAHLLQGEENENEKETLVRGLVNSSEKLDGVIRDLNYILQIKHDVHEKKEVVKLAELLSDIQLSIATLLRSEDVRIESNFDEINELVTFKSYLHSIIFNLINNSIKYKQPAVQPLIEIMTKGTKENFTLIFKDNGLGIDLERNGDKIFGLYKRFHSHREGKGMGLYMVKNQVEKIGGKIFVESEVDKGTIFTIVFTDLNLDMFKGV
ncbi:hypothetical protein CJD36_022440 [Flavipsychrobacter stenotrophus]|uniref:histidine kinase n=1 Tax=Flavipsychrobacter stenotrophus TaxID=2077091 RepID=A0A2S7SQD8_9BACT|nr:GAF domain-containing protein [Flavipsychrobacter stenotrophus]PQJ08815.1 hypothetical protein CJD36_022440 [Flavipsychrobacter stenotrophus]